MSNDTEKQVALFLSSGAKSSRTEQVYEKLKSGIVAGSIPAGYVFPNENEMCASLNVGRGTLRDAYQALATNGLITRNKSGTQVNGLRAVVKGAPFQIVAELARFQEVLELRMLLEGENARLAAERATGSELDALRGIISESLLCTEDFGRLQELDLAFHSTLADCSHNICLMNISSDVWSVFETGLVNNYSRLAAVSPDTLRDAIEQHRLVFDAIAAREPERARDAIREHIRAVYC